MLDRKSPPSFQPIRNIPLSEVQTASLDNGIEIHHLLYGKPGVFRLELVFNAGYGKAEPIAISSLFSKMLMAGTATSSTHELYERIDSLGGFIEFSQSLKTLRVTLNGLSKNFHLFLEILNEAINESIFPEKELKLNQQIAQQNLSVNQEKPAYKASREIKKLIYGVDHPASWMASHESIESVDIKSLVKFYNQEIKGAGFFISLAGDAPNTWLDSLNDVFGSSKVAFKQEVVMPSKNPSIQEVIVEDKEAVQSTLRLASVIPVTKSHDHFFPLLVANTAFGGYFGSRLMKNIREDKGYTYGISSSLLAGKESTDFVIGTSIIKTNTVDTLNEIQKELTKLQQEKLDETELETIKNYIKGTYASSINNSFDVMTKYVNRKLLQLPSDYHDRFIENVDKVTATQCIEALNTYIDFKKLATVIVGEKI